MAGDSDQTWKVLESRYVVDDPWIRFRSETVELPNGTVLDPYHVIEYPDWVNVVALTAGRDIVLIEQYRHAVRRKGLELPAGAADHPGESHLDAIKRELREETGFEGERWYLLGTTVANAARQTNRVYSYLALDVRKVGDQRLDAGEILTVRTMPWQSFSEQVSSHQLALSGLQLTCLYWLEAFASRSSDAEIRSLSTLR